MKNNFLKIFASLALVVTMTACADWEAANDDPGRPDIKELGPEGLMLLFPEMTDLMHNWQENRSQMIEQMVLNQYGGYMVTTNRWGGLNFGPFNPNVGWQDDTWDETMSRFYINYDQVAKSSIDYLLAWANVVRAAVMLRVVDTYGPIPYSKTDLDATPWVYDSVQDVYHGMIADLDAAIPVLQQFVENMGGATPKVAAYDKIYGGNFEKWIKLANSLKMRMAVRIAMVDTDYAKGVMAGAIAGGMIMSNADNAKYATTDNPYRKAAFEWSDLGSNASLTTYLNGWNDPRRSVYVTSAGGYLGIRPGIDYDGTGKSMYGELGLYAKPNFASNSDMLIFCAAESYFLLAEAAVRGWVAGDAKALYEQGVQTSMDQHGVNIGNYLSSTMSSAGASYTDTYNPENSFEDLITAAGGTALTVAWGGQTTDEMKIEAIITQKWLANYPLGGEAWAEFRRTGYPRLLPAKDNLSSASTGGVVSNPTTDLITTNIVRMVRRIPYPTSERNNNSGNMQSSVDNLLKGKDEFATELWWAKGNQPQ